MGYQATFSSAGVRMPLWWSECSCSMVMVHDIEAGGSKRYLKGDLIKGEADIISTV